MKRILTITIIIALLFYFFSNVLINLVSVPLAAYHSLESWKEAEIINHDDFHTKVKLQNQSYFKDGSWIHEEDSLAGIEIKDGKWIMFYIGTETDSTDIYDYNVTDDLLFLTNASDTLKYGIEGYTDDYLSLMYLPRGNMHFYRPKK